VLQPAGASDPAADLRRDVGSLDALTVALDRALVERGGLYQFVRLAWPVIETSPFAEGWHIEELCAHLEAVYRGEVRRLAVCVPPGMSKSLTTCVFFPTWAWIQDPTLRWIFWSCDRDLVLRDARKQRDLMASDWFLARFGDPYEIRRDGLTVRISGVRLDAQVAAKQRADRADSAQVFYTSAGGMRFGTTPRGKAIGWHAHIHVGDDPHQPMDAYAPSEIDYVCQWHDETLSTRAVDRARLRRVVQQQRIAENDLAGRCIERGYEALVLPMHYDPDRRCETSVGGDRRTQRGELLCPSRYDEQAAADVAESLGPHAAPAQLEQLPQAPGGKIFERGMFRLYKALPRQRGRVVDSWDFTFGGKKDANPRRQAKRSYVSGQRWLLLGRDAYLLDRVRGQWPYAEARAEFLRLSRQPTLYGGAPERVLVENKANGGAIESELSGQVPGIELIEPLGGKVARARAVLPDVAAGHVYVPHSAPWRDEFLDEVDRFPSEPNDQADTMTQLLAWGGRESGSAFLASFGRAGR
jgi:predicted phage terminase large subunit-like protein